MDGYLEKKGYIERGESVKEAGKSQIFWGSEGKWRNYKFTRVF